VSPVPSHDALQYFWPASGVQLHGGFLHFLSSSAMIPSWLLNRQIIEYGARSLAQPARDWYALFAEFSFLLCGFSLRLCDWCQNRER
jgi:hypothetical protein